MYRSTSIKLILLLVIILSITACGGTKVLVKSKWQQTPDTPPHESDAWRSGMIFDKKTGIIYSISNDSDNLYIRIKSSQQEQKAKILMSGVNIWLDTTAKKKETLGIAFPRHQEIGAPNPAHALGTPQGVDPLKLLVKQRAESMEIIGWNGSTEWTWQYASNNMNHITGLLEMDENNTLLYQVTVPLKLLFPNFKSGSTPIFSIGIELIGLDLNDQKGAGMSPQGGPPGGMSGSRSGGNSGGMASGSQDPSGMNSMRTGVSRPTMQMNELTMSDLLWIKGIKLATE